jgi:ABC-2 type transport system permease protein
MGIKTVLKKEFLDGLRNYRFLILAAGVLFFAIFDPIMSKLVLPELLKSQFPNMPIEVMNEMLMTTQAANIRNYMSNVYQLSTLIITFTMSGLLAAEISERTLILPVTTGKRYDEILLGKILIYGTFLVFVTTISSWINYTYAGVLFGFSLPSAAPALRAGLLQGVHMVFVLAMLIFLGALVRKPVTAGLLTLLTVFLTRAVGSMLHLHRYLPSGLLVEAEMLAASPSPLLWGSLSSSLALIVVLLCLTMIRLSRLELTRG